MVVITGSVYMSISKILIAVFLLDEIVVIGLIALGVL